MTVTLRPRFRTASLVFVLIVVLAGTVAWGSGTKIDPALRRKVLELQGEAISASVAAATVSGPRLPSRLEAERVSLRLPVVPRATPAPPVSTQDYGGVTYVEAFIELSPGATVANLERLRVVIGSRSADVVTADIPPAALTAVGALPEVVRVEASRFGGPMNDAATQETGVQTVWNTMGYRGDGVLVGVMDSGIDWTHDDFKNPDGTSRILAIWDHTDNAGPHPAGYNYGSVWSKADIDARTCRQQDNAPESGGHGTHVAGTAAGDGSGTGNGQPANRFVGVANRANILFVKTSWTLQSWADGCAWLYQTADTLGKPVAVNLSLGSIAGPHDGSTALEQFINGLLNAPGRAMCIAAANSGGQTIHAFSTLVQETGDGSNLDHTPVLAFWAYPAPLPPNGPAFGVAEVEFYYPAGLTVQWRPVWMPQQGSYVTGDWMGTTSNTRSYDLTGILAGIRLTAEAQLPYPDGRNAINFGHVLVETNTNPLNGFPFFIQLKGAGVPVHAWHVNRDMGAFIPRQVFINSQVTPPQKLIEPDDNYTLGMPGSAGAPICVGSYVTKVQWTDLDGNLQTQQGATLGDISGFSSRGPRRDGQNTLEQQKPDVTGPGEVLISTLSSALPTPTQNERKERERDGVHQKMQGTSMSSPMVTGLVALMLGKNPTLTNLQIKQILRNTARDAGNPGWDPVWGAGRVNAVAALNAVPGQTVTRGDVNADGTINPKDAILVSRHLAGLATLTGNALTAADANESGTVTQDDVDWILEKTVGLR